MTLRHIFGNIKKGIDNSTHYLQLIFFQVILGNRDIRFYNFPMRGFFPCSQPHVLTLCIGSIYNQLCGSMPMYSIVHFVLYPLEKSTGCRRIQVIINTRGIYIC